MNYILALLSLLSVSTFAVTQVNINHHTPEASRAEKIEVIRNLSDDYSLQEKTRVTLPNGKVLIKHQQLYKGIPVMDGYVVTVAKDH